MIPLYLKISGIYSYREAQEIDFRALTASHLFGIFGPVGSGKSTLLEAIMFALYGETERLNSRELRAYNMMNLKSNEAFIQFDFQAPGNKGEFRVLARGKRNSRNKEDVKFERTAYRVDPSGLIPVEVTEIPAILGISYDHFRRTIIIPQGKFQEFLQLGVKDRTEMVRELFNLQRFDLSFKTGRLQKKNDEAISLCLGKLQQLGEISEETLKQQKEELAALVQVIQLSEIQLKEQELKEKEFQQIKDQFTALVQHREKRELLNGQEPEIIRAEQFLADYDECVSGFKSSMEMLDEKRRQLGTDRTSFSALTETVQKTTLEAKEAETRFGEAKKQYDSRDQLKIHADELKICAEINAAAKEVSDLGERIEKGDLLVQEKNRDQESLHAQALLLKDNQEALKSQQPPLEKLKAASDWFSAKNLLLEKQKSLKEQETAYRKELAGIDTTLQEYRKLAGIQIPEDKIEPDLLFARLNSQKETLLHSLKDLESRIMHLEVEEKLKSYTGSLEEGKPCPLCGSTDHPKIMEPRDTSAEHQNLRNEKSGLETSVKALENALTGIEIMSRTLTSRQQELGRIMSGLAELEKSAGEHESKHPWPGMEEAALKSQWEHYNKIAEESETLEKLIKEAQTKSEEAAGLSKKYGEAILKFREELLVKKQDISNLQRRLSMLSPEEYTGTTPEALLEKAQELTDQFLRCEETYRIREKELQSVRDNLLTLEGSRQKSEESLLLLEKSVISLSKQLEEKIRNSRFREEGRVREILSSSFDRTGEQERIRQYRNALENLKTTISQLETALEGKSYDPAAHESLRTAVADLRTRLDQMREKKGGFDNELEKLERSLQESARLREELRNLEVRRENLKTLSDLFRAQGFVNFVSTRYLRNLVNSANERFYRLTRQQLKLELDDENNFRIRDYLNDGQWRNVKTLSGGQTFQASLCLALALADNIQQLNQGGQNFFFLDEGFGTLDKESLELVFDTLKSLRKENRIVGVISHVEEMQQEITSWLKITNDEETGSRITTSWT